MMRFSFIFMLLAPCVAGSADKPDNQPDFLKPWQGSWDLTHSSSVGGNDFVVAERIGLGGKDVLAMVKGNQVFVGEKLMSTLTTDFSDSNLDVEKKILHDRKPVMFTLPNGKCVMCAYEFIEDYIVIQYPHTSGNVSWKSKVVLKRHK